MNIFRKRKSSSEDKIVQTEREHRTSEITRKRDRKNHILNRISKISSFFILLLFVIQTVSIAYITSGSMEPTLMTGNWILFNKVAYLTRDIQRGDIIMFDSHEITTIPFTKRVIGIEGDVITFQDGFVFLNGEKLEETYVAPGSETHSSKTFHVPKNTVFVMGDNRENSGDSRFFDQPYISVDDVQGKMVGYVSPFFHEKNSYIWTLIAILCMAYLTLFIPSWCYTLHKRKRLLGIKEYIIKRHDSILSKQ